MKTKTKPPAVSSMINLLKPFNLAGIAFFFLSITYLTSCKTGTKKENSDNKPFYNEAVPCVCIWDKISARQEPLRSAAVVTPLNLGEMVTYLGITVYDSTYKNQEYLKVKLTDGSMVWVPAFGMVKNSKPAVISNEVQIYLRPDLLTITEKKLSPMDIIAVTETQDGWVNFVSEKRTLTGWIIDESINYNQEEIAFSLSAKRILTEKNNKSLLVKIDSVFKINPYQNSVFLPLLNEIRSQEMEKMLVEDMIMQSLDSIR